MRTRMCLVTALFLAACGSEPVTPFFSGDATGLDGASDHDSTLDDAGVSDATTDDGASDTDDTTPDDTDDDGASDTDDSGGTDTDDTTPDDTTDGGETDTDDGGGTDTIDDVQIDVDAPVCGDGVAEGAEACDGADLRGATCETLGFDGGALACRVDCTDYLTSACTTACVPECDGRECGPDPTCGISCGSCGDGVCLAEGVCQAPSERGPRIVSFEANRLSLGEGAELTLTAVVTDPDGADDVVAGTLADAIEGATYRSFSRSDGAAWSVTVTWDELNDVVPIDFDTDAGRTLQARFFDNDGNVATALTTITLTCDGDGACEGVCTDLATDLNCGECGLTCGGDTTCIDGLCTCPGGGVLCDGVCTPLGTDANCTSCGETCSDGTICTPEGCACPDGEALCDGVCTPLGTLDDCLACDDSCTAFGSICEPGGCTCPGGRVDCDGACVDLGTSSNCLSCGDVCDGGRTCTDEGCVCPDGRTLCDGTCVFTDTIANCGGCGIACEGDGEACVDGVCACPDGERLCGETCGDTYNPATCGPGCEVCTGDTWCDGNRCQQPTPHEIRIGTTGALEVYLDDGSWESVCGVDFGETDAAAACRQLGGDLVAYETGLPVSDDAPYGLDRLACGLFEERLTACSYTSTVLDCPTDGGVSVSCTAPDAVDADCEAFPVGLIRINEVNASSNSGAFVELYGAANRALDGLRLELWDRAGGVQLQDVALSGSTNSAGYAIVGGTSSLDRVGLFSGEYPSTISEGLRLVNCDGTVIDAVAWGFDSTGYTNVGEGFDLPYMSAPSFGRIPNGRDTDDNLDDISRLASTSARAANTEYVPPLVLPRSWSGSISGSESTFNRPTTFCGTGTIAYNYDLISLANPEPNPVDVQILARYYDDGLFTGSEQIAGAFTVYFGGFNASSPTANCEAGASGEPAFLNTTIPANTTMYIAVTRRVNADDVDDWDLTVSAR